MKELHRPEFFCWSVFDEARNIDFHSFLWVRPEGNVLVDPLPLSPHDEAHLKKLGGASLIILTNSDHVRSAQQIAAWSGARIAVQARPSAGATEAKIARVAAQMDRIK